MASADDLKGPWPGTYRKTKNGVIYVRKVIPAPLRPAFDGRRAYVASTGTADANAAKPVAERQLQIWTAEIKARAALGVKPVAELSEVRAAVENWRAEACRIAAGADAWDIAQQSIVALVEEVRRSPATGGGDVVLGPLNMAVVGADRSTNFPSIGTNAVAWARAYFEVNADASRSLDLPHVVGVHLERLQAAARDPGQWAQIADFDALLDEAATAGGLHGAITPVVREDARQPFAKAALEVETHREAERRRAAAIMAAVEASDPGSIKLNAGPATYQPRPDDVTVAEGLRRYKDWRIAEYGKADTEKDTGHIIRALVELVGADKPLRAVEHDDCVAVRDLLRRVPANAGKLYPGVPLVETVERAAAEIAANEAEVEAAKREGRKPKKMRKVRPMAPLTVWSYVTNLSAFFNWAAEPHRRLVDSNPAQGLAGAKVNQVKRRAFMKGELETVFGALEEERRANSYKFWVPAILTYSGCRLNEVCQLLTEDVKEHEGIPYLDLSAYDEDGVRIDQKRLKTAGSERCVPLHPEILAAGFLEFVAMRRAAGEERLFPELKASATGLFSQDASKWFGLHCGRVGLAAPSLTMHSLRHGYRDAGRAARLPRDVVNYLGGWKVGGSGGEVGEGYGNIATLHQLAENLEHVTLLRPSGGFTLGPPPAAAGEDQRAA